MTDYKTKIFEYLDRLDIGIVEIKNICKPENRDKFLEVVIEYIQQGTKNGYVTELNGDRTKIKKFDLIL